MTNELGCAHDGCPNEVIGKGLCIHHISWECMEPGCNNRVVTRGRCFACYQRHRYRTRHDTPGRVALISDLTCDEPGCEEKHHAKGKCLKHYQELYYQSKPRCLAGDCDRAAMTVDQLCKKHDNMLKALGDLAGSTKFMLERHLRKGGPQTATPECWFWGGPKINASEVGFNHSLSVRSYIMLDSPSAKSVFAPVIHAACYRLWGTLAQAPFKECPHVTNPIAQACLNPEHIYLTTTDQVPTT